MALTIPGIPVVTPDDTHVFWAQDALGTIDYQYTRAQIVAGVKTALDAEIASTDAEISALQSDKLNLDGSNGPMTGALTLAGDPTVALHAATKQYVDTTLATYATINDAALTGTPTAPTAAVDTEDTQLATTAFVLAQTDENFNKRTIVTTATFDLEETHSGYVSVNRAGQVDITLPVISTLTDPQRVFYRIKDEGFNANNTTQVINIDRDSTDTIENALTTYSITTPGEDLIIYNDGVSAWFISGVDTVATETTQGVLYTASSADALALTDDSKAITPSKLGEVFDQELYAFNEIGSASKTLVEADAGTWYVTFTTSGGVNVDLPNPGTLNNAPRCYFEIVDAGGNASVNAITISAPGSNINGGSSLVLNADRASTKFLNDGSGWFTTSNTQSAIDEAVSQASVIVATPSFADVLAQSNLTGTNDISINTGQKIIYNNSGYALDIMEPLLTGNVVLTLPNVSGTLASTGSVLDLAGGTMTGDITMDDATLIKFSDGTFTGSFAHATGMAGNVVYTLPDTSGTIALTSDIVGSYLPLAGGTMTGDITLNSNKLIGPGGPHSFLFGNSGFASVDDTIGRYTMMRYVGTLEWNDGTSINNALEIMNTTASQTWTMPDATGTVALTSDLGPAYSLDTLSGSGAIATTAGGRTDYTISAGADALTLANGTAGDEITIVCVSDGGGTGTLTPTTLNGYTTITFNDQGDSVTLQYGTSGWAIMSAFNVVIA
jgi:hypothetical protein